MASNTEEIDKFIDKCKKYIVEDKIIRNYNDNDSYDSYDTLNLSYLDNYYDYGQDPSFETIDTTEKLASLLDDYKEYNNNTYLYFKCFYHYCKKEYDIMLKLANDVVEPNIYHLIGRYYRYIEYDFASMKKYYLMAIELNNAESMCGLGNYYHFIEMNFDLMKKYYLMAIELGYPYGMFYLGYYYYITEQNYNKMKEYFHMAIKFNNIYAMHMLGLYYYVEKNYELMKKYYIMSIELNNKTSILNFKDYCKYIENDETNYYKYIYYPRILMLILIFQRQNNKKKINIEHGSNINGKIIPFLPDELYIKIYDDYILNT